MLPNFSSMIFAFSSGDLELMHWDDQTASINHEEED
jgi:hypothetical protein